MVDYYQIASRLTQVILKARPFDSSYHTKNISMSDVPKCIRQTYYKMTKTPIDEGKQEENDRANFIMSFGNQFETVIGDQLALAGFYKGKVRLGDPIVNTSGITDPCAIFESENIITECKGTSDKHYKLILKQLKDRKHISEITPDYYGQLQGYLWAHPNPHVVGMIIIGNRNMSYTDGMPPFIVLPVEKDLQWKAINYKRLDKLNSSLDSKIVPEREYTNPEDYPCSSCSWLNRCYTGVVDGGELNNGDSAIP